MTKTTRKPARAKTDHRAEITEKLAAGIDALATSATWQAYLDVQARFHTYSFGNSMLIMAQCPHATRVTSFGTTDKVTGKPKSGWLLLGRHVKGPDETGQRQRAIWIWAPSSRKVEDEETGETRRIPFFVPVPVFDISQTEGEPLPGPVRKLTGEAPEGMIARAVAFINSAGYDVEFVDRFESGSKNGDTTWSLRRVRIATDGRSTMGQLKTLLHEAGHVLLHESSEAPAGLKELEAESVAYIAAAALGADTSDYSFGYVLSWMRGDPGQARKMIRESGSRIQKAARQIVDGMPAQAAGIAPASAGIAEDAAA
jgi:antirestriction protein ArdC